MSTSYEISAFDQVIQYVNGQRDNDSTNYRDASPLELEQRDRIIALEKAAEYVLDSHESRFANDAISKLSDIL